MKTPAPTNKHRYLGLLILSPVLIGSGILLASVPPMQSYPKHESIENEREANQPAPIEEKTFGYSELGRPITGYEIGSGEECLLIFGGIHGDEKGTVDLVRRFADEVIVQPDLVPTTRKLVVVPLVNPDGYFDGIYRNNANGVNINRNFATSGWTAYPDQQTFAGQQPFSEKESQVIKTIVEECVPSVMVAFHSQGGIVSPEAGSESLALAEWYINKTGYTYFNDWDYPGTATKWFTETTGNPSITVEITNHSDSDWEINNNALLELLAW